MLSAHTAGRTLNPTKRRRMTVEQALSWAYREEVPKIRDEGVHRGPALPAVHPMWRAGAFGSRIDNWASRDPGFPLAMGEAHPDAILIKNAVDGLDRDALDLWCFLIPYKLGDAFDLGGLIEKARSEVQSLVVRTATSRVRPDTEDRPAVEPVRSITGQITVWVRAPQTYETANGDPIVVEHDMPTKPLRKGAYPTGAFSKLRYVPSAASVALDRARYAAWWAALAQIAETLTAVGLASIELMAWDAPASPWTEETVAEASSPVMPSLLPPRRQILKDRRTAGRRQAPRRASEVRQIDPGDWTPPPARRA